MECPICFEIINNSCVGSCMHHICYKCLIKWLNHGGTKCPVCKKYIYEIKFDKEFDQINNINNINNSSSNSSNNNISEYTKKIIIDFSDGIPPGITIASNKGIGLKIIKLNKNDKIYKAGFRINDVILFLNNVPCINHSESIKIIKYAYENRKQLIIESMIVKK